MVLTQLLLSVRMHSMLREATIDANIYLVCVLPFAGWWRRRESGWATYTGFFSSAAARHATSTPVRGAQGGSAGMLLPHLQVLQVLHQTMRLNVRAHNYKAFLHYANSANNSQLKGRGRIGVETHLHCWVKAVSTLSNWMDTWIWPHQLCLNLYWVQAILICLNFISPPSTWIVECATEFCQVSELGR